MPFSPVLCSPLPLHALFRSHPGIKLSTLVLSACSVSPSALPSSPGERSKQSGQPLSDRLAPYAVFTCSLLTHPAQRWPLTSPRHQTEYARALCVLCFPLRPAQLSCLAQ